MVNFPFRTLPSSAGCPAFAGGEYCAWWNDSSATSSTAPAGEQIDDLAEEKLKVDKRTTCGPPRPKPEKPKETTPEFIASLASVLVVGLFIITFCLQAFEIPSSSMENTLLIGDHVFVDRVLLAPTTNWFPLIPYRQVAARRYRRFPFAGRARAVRGQARHRHSRRPHSPAGQRGLPQWRSAWTSHTPIHNDTINPYRDNFPTIPASEACQCYSRVAAHLAPARAKRRVGGPAGLLFRHGRQPRRQLRQPLLGICSWGKRDRPPHVHLLVFPDPGGPVPQEHAWPTASDSCCTLSFTSSTRRAGHAC